MELEGKILAEELRIPHFAIPTSEEELEDLLEKGGLKGRTIHDLEQPYFRSASKMTQKQFALLRVIFPGQRTPEQIDQFKADYGLADVWQKATHIVRDAKELGKYLKVIEKREIVADLGESSELWPGSFTGVRELQEEILGLALTPKPVTPKRVRKRRGSSGHDDTENPLTTSASTGPGAIEQSARNGVSSEAAEDEAGPNAVLILLLQRLSSLVRKSNLFWSLSRIHYTATFSRGSFSAYTDGVLRSTKTWDTMAVVEVKKRPRGTGMRQIQFQEAGEIVGWFLHPHRNIPRFNR